MLGLLNGIVEAKKRVENNISYLSSKEVEDLKLYEQLTSLEQAESAMRSAIRAEHEAKEQHPELFSSIAPKPLEIT